MLGAILKPPPCRSGMLRTSTDTKVVAVLFSIDKAVQTGLTLSPQFPFSAVLVQGFDYCNSQKCTLQRKMRVRLPSPNIRYGQVVIYQIILSSIQYYHFIPKNPPFNNIPHKTYEIMMNASSINIT